MDAVFLLSTLVFFGLALSYVAGCERLK